MEGGRMFNKEEFNEMVGFVVAQMTEECFEHYSLDTSPEIVFSTFIFAMIDKWHETHDIDKSQIPEFLETVKRIGAEIYEEERRSN